MSNRTIKFSVVFNIPILLFFAFLIFVCLASGFQKPENYIFSTLLICFSLCVSAAIVFSLMKFSKWRALQKKYGAILVIDEEAQSVTDYRLSEKAYFIHELHGVRNGLAVGPPLLSFFVENQLLILEWPDRAQRKKIMLNFMHLEKGAEARKRLVDMAVHAGKWKYWLQK